jgi:hypothetical protein
MGGAPDRSLDESLETAYSQGWIALQEGEHLASEIASLGHGTGYTRALKKRCLEPASLVSARAAYKVQGTAYAGSKNEPGEPFFANSPQY